MKQSYALSVSAYATIVPKLETKQEELFIGWNYANLSKISINKCYVWF